MNLERYTRVIVAIAGTVFLVGLLLALVAPVTMVATRLLTRRKSAIRTARVAGRPAVAPSGARLVYGSPILTGQSEYVMVPVRLAGAPSAAGAYLKSYSSGAYGGISRSSWVYYGCGAPFHNLVFRHKTTGESHLLLDQPGVISACYFPHERAAEGEPEPPRFLLLGISQEDTNGDGAIDEDDAVIGYLADLAGRQRRQVTPPKTQLRDWDIDRASRQLYLRVRGDTDQNGKFTDQDDEWLLQVSADQPAIGTSVVGDETREALRRLLLR